jgi:hypothetical protein
MRPSGAIWLVCALAAGAACEGGTRIGAPCQLDAHCGQEQGFALVCQTSVPGGSCTLRDCTPDDPATPEDESLGSCPASARCVRDGIRPRYLCRLACWTPADCRPIWDCQAGDCRNAVRCALVHPSDDPLATEPPPDAPRACAYQPEAR